ncbi:hypothetical protein [Oceanicaulis alexandrii]|uniref:hypothetical protein n=1 Tax=Oceanicaulis alexandrii TaxID=153233 RepID=UPI003BAF24FA
MADTDWNLDLPFEQIVGLAIGLSQDHDVILRLDLSDSGTANPEEHRTIQLVMTTEQALTLAEQLKDTAHTVGRIQHDPSDKSH